MTALELSKKTKNKNRYTFHNSHLTGETFAKVRKSKLEWVFSSDKEHNRRMKSYFGKENKFVFLMKEVWIVNYVLDFKGCESKLMDLEQQKIPGW